MSERAIVEVAGLHKFFRRGSEQIDVLEDLTLEVPQGEYLALMGPSGSGKTTLLGVMGGLAEPDKGRVLIDGRPPREHGGLSGYHRDVVGFVFQLHYLLPVLDAQSNVEVPLVAAGTSRGERRARSAELLAEMGLADRADHLPSELSGGERQRVSVARALANNPRLLLADEPTGALDSDSSDRVLELLEDARAKRGTTMIVVTHDEAIAARADRILRMLDGRIV
jgi:putative ABC transport system ATP-binding protein